MNIADPSICLWEPTTYFFFSNNIWSSFIYYSHLLPSLFILFLALFVFINNPKNKASLSLFFLAIIFTLWSLTDLILWASDRSDLIMFFWSILIYFDLLVYIGAFYFIYSFLNDRWPGWKHELVIFFLFLPLFLFTHTSLNLVGFDFTNCWREAIEGPLWQYYLNFAELLLVVYIVFYSRKLFKATTDKTKRTIIIQSTIGVLIFLLMFSLGNITGSFSNSWDIGQYGLFGMPVFALFLIYLIVKQNAFDIKVLSTEALVTILALLITSILFIQNIESVRVITVVTITLTIVIGFLLVRSVKKEILLREEVETLAGYLEIANVRLQQLDKQKSEFVSIASHQLRSPLTSIRGYASMLIEGSFGKIPAKALEPIERIEKSSKLMALAIEDYLNVSRIESGNMKYNKADFNLRDEVEHVCDDLRSDAIKRGLVLIFRTDLNSRGVINADLGKTVQIVQNLIHNSIKYTEKGTVKVLVRDDIKKKKIYVDIIDTGIGMSKKTQQTIFQKFERAENANSVNVSGTGLGLYVAVKMAEAMEGGITAFSEGDGMGSRFTFEMPLAL